MPGLSYYNPFQQAELRIPKQFQEAFARYTRTYTGGAGKVDHENSPLDRYVDLWMLAVCVGARDTLTSDASWRKPDVKEWHRFIQGSIFQGDTTRIELLAISLSGDPFIIASPNKAIELTNDMAAIGLPRVIEMIQSGQGKPLWNIAYHLQRMLQDQGDSESDTASPAG